MSLKESITEDMKSAMRAKEKRLLGTIRLITAAIKQIEVDERIENLEDARVTDVLVKMVKQRRDSITAFKTAERHDLVEQEEFELVQIHKYLPQALTADEINVMIDEAMKATGATSIKEMGKVMGMLKPKMAGRADMGAVSKAIKEKLSS